MAAASRLWDSQLSLSVKHYQLINGIMQYHSLVINARLRCRRNSQQSSRNLLWSLVKNNTVSVWLLALCVCDNHQRLAMWDLVSLLFNITSERRMENVMVVAVTYRCLLLRRREEINGSFEENVLIGLLWRSVLNSACTGGAVVSAHYQHVPWSCVWSCTSRASINSTQCAK